jgi:hypothetical protein
MDVVRNCFGATQVRDNERKKPKNDYEDEEDETSARDLDGEEFHW